MAHLWAYGLTPGMGVTFDSEGLLSTIAAQVNLLAGVLVGSRMVARRERRVGTIAIAGVVLTIAGLLLGLSGSLPIIRKLWTPSFSLLSTGVSLVGFAALCMS